MSFFRRRISSEPVVARMATAGDHSSLERLVHTANRRFLTSSVAEVMELFDEDPAAVLEVAGRVVGATSFGWRAAPVAWLRTFLIQDHQIAPGAALRKLAEPMHPHLRGDGVTLVAVTLDEWNDPWLREPLRRAGYRPMVEVVGFEKTRLDRPAPGNQAIAVRAAQPADLEAVLRLDAECFPLPWVKGADILAPALTTSPCFIVAELSGNPVGYAFGTVHQSGRLVHLVRIAVAPPFQGRGIGVRLLAEIVDYCAAHSVDVLTLNTQADNLPAQRLYEWFGFVRTGEHQTVLGLDIGGTE